MCGLTLRPLNWCWTSTTWMPSSGCSGRPSASIRWRWYDAIKPAWHCGFMGLGGQWVQGVQLGEYIRVLMQESVQRELMGIAGLGQGFTPRKLSGTRAGVLASLSTPGAFVQAAVYPGSYGVKDEE